MIPEEKPCECDPMISLMQKCWDQDRRKRPLFSGAEADFFSAALQSVLFEIYTMTEEQYYLLQRILNKAQNTQGTVKVFQQL